MAKNQGKVGQDKGKIVAALPEACRDEAAAVEFMEAQRWGDEPRCPHCGFDTVWSANFLSGVLIAQLQIRLVATPPHTRVGFSPCADPA